MRANNFSVLFSIYHKEQPAFFEESLVSVFNQSLLPNEVVIVKDGLLTDELDKIIDDYLLKFPKILKIVSLEKNVGLGKALNIGLENCSNPIVARMDTDDICEKDRFSIQYSKFEDNDNLGIVGSDVLEFDGVSEEKMKIVPHSMEEIVKYSKLRNPFNHPSVMFKKSVIEDCGGYKHMPYFEDYYLWLRVINSGVDFLNINKPLVHMRANINMFERRGGWKYFKHMLHFRRVAYNEKLISFSNLFLGTMIHSVVILVPNNIRTKIYRRALRDKI